ncbi:MAG: hypothetical protein K6E75_02110 [Lachnospiraceae bacterium]|nr:hypothetical protein [Lachnospiraceae bacterium]
MTVVTDGFDFMTLLTQIKYVIAAALCALLRAVYAIFRVIEGSLTVVYQGDEKSLASVFFSHRTVANLYFVMCLVGVVFALVIGVTSIIRKRLDVDEMKQLSVKQMLKSFFGSVLFMAALTFGMTLILFLSSVALEQISVRLRANGAIGKKQERDFTDAEIAAMARSLSTIGNYSFNVTHNNRFNLNACFNDIRPDMEYLQKQGVFDYNYPTRNEDGDEIHTWQNVLQKIAFSQSLSQNVDVDIYYEGMNKALLEAMEIIHTDKDFHALKTFTQEQIPGDSIGGEVYLDRICFLMGTMDGAINEEYNKKPGLFDGLRGKFYIGSETEDGNYSVYDRQQVFAGFHANKIRFLFIDLAAALIFGVLFVIVIGTLARILNLLLLYLSAPLVFATGTMEDDGRIKKWLTAFAVQAISVYASILAVQIVQLLIPVVISPELSLFGGALTQSGWKSLDYLTRLLLIFVGLLMAQKAGNLVSEVLAKLAGIQAISFSSVVESIKERNTEGLIALSGFRFKDLLEGFGKNGKSVTSTGAQPVSESVGSEPQQTDDLWEMPDSRRGSMECI